MRRRRVPPAPPPGVLGPESIELHLRHLRAADAWCRPLAPVEWPAEVGAGWLAPLLGYPGSIDVALHVEPIPNEVAASHLRRQRARFESTRRIDAQKRRLADPELDAAAADADELSRAIARGESRLFRAGLYVTVRAASEEELAAEAHKVGALASSLLLQLGPVSFRASEGWAATLPLGIDTIRKRRTLNTDRKSVV